MHSRHVAVGLGVITAFLSASSWCAIAYGHPGHGHGDNMLTMGWLHPWLGLDHILAMVTVAMLGASTRRDHGAALIWPAAFLAIVAIGIGMGGFLGPLSAAAPSAALAVVCLGMAVALGRTGSTVPCATALAVGALIHGWAHGAELANSSAPLASAVGLLAATAAMQACGVLASHVLRPRNPSDAAVRFSGALAACVGLALLLGGA